MYNETYEDYIRSILGYPNYNNSYENLYNYNMMRNNNFESDKQLEDCYPEIYKIVYPMINKACMDNTKPITSELIDELTHEIYSSLETGDESELNINLKNELKSTTGNRNTSSSIKYEKAKENRGDNRQFRSRTLQDLIRILIIREILGRPGFSGNRPPVRPSIPPTRPPFSGGPGLGPRPPFMPREHENFNSNIYEI